MRTRKFVDQWEWRKKDFLGKNVGKDDVGGR